MLFKKRALATLIPLLFVQPAFAAEDAAKAAKAEAAKVEKFTTEKVTVNGILPDNLEAVPGSFSIIDTEELEVSRPFTTGEALKNVPGVNVIGEDVFGLGHNIGIRGMDPRRSSRTLLLEDGMPLMLAPYGDPSAHYSTPLERIERIEVVKGSGQILYGPQTVGGMINFVTKPVPRKGVVEGSVTATAGNNDYKGLHANVGYGNERGGVMFDALKKQSDGIRDNHKSEVQEYTLKSVFDITDRQTVKAKVSYYKEDSNITETGLGEAEYAQNKFQAPSGGIDNFQHERKSAQIQHIFTVDDKMKLSTQAYYVDSFRSSFRQTDQPGGFDEDNNATGTTVLSNPGPGAATGAFTAADAALSGGRHRPRNYNYFGIEPRLDFSHNAFGLENDAVIGFRYHEEKINRQGYRGNTAATQNLDFARATLASRENIDIDVQSKSYYVQNTFHINNWAITPGVRYEDMKIQTNVLRAGDQNIANGNQSNNQSAVLPGLGIAWNGINNTTVFAGVHQGFAPPRPDRDLNANDQPINTKPEKSTNWELGTRSSYFKGTSLQSTLFLTQFDDIVINNGSGTFINAGKSEMSGVEFAGRIDFGTIYNNVHNIYLAANYTNLFTAKFKTDGLNASDGIVSGGRLPYAPKHIASVNVGYQHPVGVDARVGVDYISTQQVDPGFRVLSPIDAANSGLAGDIPSYALLNASVNFKPVGSKATYFLSGHNLADREYLSNRVNGMFAGRGRTVIAGVRYQF